MRWPRRLCVVAAVLLACAAAAPRESARHREKRRKKILEGLTDFERSRITELHTQGLKADHINVQLGLNRNAQYVTEVIASLKIDKPATKRYMPKRNKAKPTPRPSPRDKAAAHREMLRERKGKRRREL